jgi:nicotinamidase-related amidase
VNRLGALLALAASLADGATPRPTTLRALYGVHRPSTLRAAHTAVVLVDFQEEFFPARGCLPLPRGPAAVGAATRLVRWAHASGILVVHVRNVVERPDSPLFAAGSPTTAIVGPLTPAASDLVVTKRLAGGFSRTNLDELLRARGIDVVVIGGLMTHLAVAITASDATVLGYRAIVASDATATRALPGAAGGANVDEETLQRVALAILADRVADVLTTDEIVGLAVER